MSGYASERIASFEGVRDQIVTALVKNGVDKLDLKALALLEHTISTGVKMEIAQQDMALKQKSQASEEASREAINNYILAQREEGNRRAKAVREGQLEGGSSGLPNVTERPLLPNEGMQGQYQVCYDVLSGQKPFNPDENRVERPARESLPEVPGNP